MHTYHTLAARGWEEHVRVSLIFAISSVSCYLLYSLWYGRYLLCSTQTLNLPVLEMAFPFPVMAPISSTVLLQIPLLDSFMCSKYPNAQFTISVTGCHISSNGTHFQYCPFTDPTSGNVPFGTVPKLAICHYW